MVKYRNIIGGQKMKKTTVLRSVALVLAAMLVVLSFSSCGKKKQKEEPKEPVQWPSGGLAEHIPEFDGVVTDVSIFSDSLDIDCETNSGSEYYAYVESCKEMGYTVDAQEDNTSYEALNADGYRIELTLWSGGDMWIRVYSPEPPTTAAPETTTSAPTTAAPETTTQAPETTTAAPETTTEAPTTKAPETTTEAPTTTEAAVDESIIRPEVKDAIDAYEDWVDQYIVFMDSYDASDWSLLTEYVKLMGELTEWEYKFDKIDEDYDLTEAELLYYIDVETRCDNKLASYAVTMS